MQPSISWQKLPLNGEDHSLPTRGMNEMSVVLKSIDAPSEQAKRTAMMETVAADGYLLLDAIFTSA